MKTERWGVVLAMLAGLGACADETEFEPPPPEVVATELELRNDMRELWTAHVVWTRVVVMTSVAGLPEAPDATERLLTNQDDIANALRPFYGDAAADEVQRLLREHITIALDVVYGAATGDPGPALDAWYANADEIAVALSQLNPNWPLADLQALMTAHLDTTVAEVTARLEGDWAADVDAFDVVLDHALHMADVLAAGISAQFPNLVIPDDELSTRDEDLIVSMRDLWQDHVIWTRMYLIAATAALPEAPFAAERLLENQDQIGDAIRPFYGDAAGDVLTVLLREHILLAVDVVYNASIDDGPATQAALAEWFVNADEIATALSSLNPNLEFVEMQDMMHMHLDQTVEEANARLAADWVRDIQAYDAVVLHILHMSDTISVAVAEQFEEPEIE